MNRLPYARQVPPIRSGSGSWSTNSRRKKGQKPEMQLRTKLISSAIAAALPLLALTGASTATAATAARPALRATTQPFTATAAAIPNKTCWYVTADDGVGLYMRDAGLHNATTIGNYNACFYFAANGSNYGRFGPGYEMQINPAGADCEKVVYPSTGVLYDEPCDDQHNGDTLETWAVEYVQGSGYLLLNVEGNGDALALTTVNSLASGTVVKVDGNGHYPYWGLQAS
ncbi:MAG TPA: hypothetical protein VH637_24285 [Streptosporangiaceae bacterium]